jgi:esterase/lipase superfamily enzyme
MFQQLERMQSHAMGRTMHLWRFGHYGPPLLVFPSASGMAHEWLAQGMIDALTELIECGKIKLYCTESNVAEAWTDRHADPAWRIGRHAAFERYVVDELVPWIRADCRSRKLPVAVAGTSLGAYYAANFSLKQPEIFRFGLCLSGRYDISWLTGGFVNQEIYFNNPLSYLPGLEGAELERVRRHAHLVLVCGQGRWEDGNLEETHRLAELLAVKGIRHERDIWGADVTHEWPWWRRQAAHHLGRAFG